jgi:hypothetical protein
LTFLCNIAAVEQKFVPSYVSLDGKVLKFDAYMKEDVPEIPNEGYRIRQFSICYFLVDDSIRISELKQVTFADFFCLVNDQNCSRTP